MTIKIKTFENQSNSSTQRAMQAPNQMRVTGIRQFFEEQYIEDESGAEAESREFRRLSNKTDYTGIVATALVNTAGNYLQGKINESKQKKADAEKARTGSLTQEAVNLANQGIVSASATINATDYATQDANGNPVYKFDDLSGSLNAPVQAQRDMLAQQLDKNPYKDEALHVFDQSVARTKNAAFENLTTAAVTETEEHVVDQFVSQLSQARSEQEIKDIMANAEAFSIGGQKVLSGEELYALQKEAYGIFEETKINLALDSFRVRSIGGESGVPMSKNMFYAEKSAMLDLLAESQRAGHVDTATAQTIQGSLGTIDNAYLAYRSSWQTENYIRDGINKTLVLDHTSAQKYPEAIVTQMIKAQEEPTSTGLSKQQLETESQLLREGFVNNTPEFIADRNVWLAGKYSDQELSALTELAKSKQYVVSLLPRYSDADVSTANLVTAIQSEYQEAQKAEYDQVKQLAAMMTIRAPFTQDTEGFVARGADPATKALREARVSQLNAAISTMLSLESDWANGNGQWEQGDYLKAVMPIVGITSLNDDFIGLTKYKDVDGKEHTLPDVKSLQSTNWNAVQEFYVDWKADLGVRAANGEFINDTEDFVLLNAQLAKLQQKAFQYHSTLGGYVNNPILQKVLNDFKKSQEQQGGN